ncbi:MAG: hypothetical protein R3D30_00545 [Hyphomicrobiales bacterium]
MERLARDMLIEHWTIASFPAPADLRDRRCNLIGRLGPAPVFAGAIRTDLIAAGSPASNTSSQYANATPSSAGRLAAMSRRSSVT